MNQWAANKTGRFVGRLAAKGKARRGRKRGEKQGDKGGCTYAYSEGREQTRSLKEYERK